MTSNDKFDFLDDPLENEHAGSAVNVQSVKISLYRYREVCFCSERVADLIRSLPDIQSSYVKSLVALVLVLVFDYRSRMIN